MEKICKLCNIYVDRKISPDSKKKKKKNGQNDCFPLLVSLIQDFHCFYCLGMRFSQEGFCWQPLIITSMFFARLWKGISRRSTLNAQGTGGLKR